jgi:hypothetical protein
LKPARQANQFKSYYTIHQPLLDFNHVYCYSDAAAAATPSTKIKEEYERNKLLWYYKSNTADVVINIVSS